MSINNLENTEAGAGPKPPRKKRMSERQLAANRANAKKCTGPNTPAGKARSRFNSLKHGLCADNVCLPGDDLEEYERRRYEYIDYYQPANLVEWDLVEDLVAARWRKNRLIKYERNLVLDTVVRARIDLAKHYHELSPDAESALALRELIEESRSVHLIDRYEARLQRNIDIDMRRLDDAQRNRPPAQDGPEASVESPGYTGPEPATPESPNETIPTAGHSPDPAAPGANAAKPTTIVPKPRPVHPQPAVMAATAAGAGQTGNLQPQTNWQPLTDNWQLTTDN